MTDIYQCRECGLGYDMTEDMLSRIEIESPTGESMIVTIVECPFCEGISLPEGFNNMSWKVADEEVEVMQQPGSEVEI